MSQHPHRTTSRGGECRTGGPVRAGPGCSPSGQGRNIIPYRYSMAPVFRAEREVQPEEPAEESAAAPAAEDAAPSKVVTISQPADDGSVIVMIGQPVERNCGACFPLETGTVVGFVDVPDGVVLRGGSGGFCRSAQTSRFCRCASRS